MRYFLLLLWKMRSETGENLDDGMELVKMDGDKKNR